VLTAEKSDLIRRAEKIYEDRLKVDLEANHLNEFVVIEPDSGDYFLGRTSLEATLHSRAAHPDKVGFLIRIGHRAAYFIGASK
jgi:hypothetical protein